MLNKDPILPPVPIAGPEQDSVRLPKGRLFALKLVFALFFVVVAGRLVEIQILEAAKYQDLARRQYEQTYALPAVRGAIYDQYGNVLVSNSMQVSFGADPVMVGDHADQVAGKFSKVFGKPRSYYLTKLRSTRASGSLRRFVWLERRVHPEVAKHPEFSGLNGIVLVDEAKRLYHYNDVAGTLVGFTDIDNKGISGLELQFEEYLRGKDGSIVMLRDGLGRPRPSIDYPRREPRDGHHLTLTLDLAYQSIVEEELKRGVVENKADAGLAVMLNHKTGEILALANVPSLNPNMLTSYDVNAARNRVVTDVFEPGSVFKVVTASAAYEHHLVSPEKRYYADRGKYKAPLPGGKFRLIRDTHEHDWLTFQEAIEVSSNIVMAKVGPTIGPERLYRQARDFGFGIPTGVDLPGEVRGRLKKPFEWSGTTLQTLAYGYEVAVTPLQIASAYAAVANNGVLMKPYVVARVQNSEGETVLEQRPQRIRRVISPETATLLTHAFEGVVERGTATDARIQGVRVAGKTGTARQVIDGKYDEEHYTASFVGYFPAEDPQVVCLVMLDKPRARGYYGGLTSAPVFRAIAERIVNTTGRFTKKAEPREHNQPEKGISVPDVRTLQATIAMKILEGQGLKGQVIGTGGIVMRQIPDPGRRLESGDVVQLVVNGTEAAATGGRMAVPDVRGMSLRRAINRLVIDNFDVQVRGSGVVVEQVPAAGQNVQSGATIHLVCEPRTLFSAALY